MGRRGALVLLVAVLLTLGGAGPVRAATVTGGRQDTGTLAERLISLPIEGLTRALDLLGLVDIQQLIFSPDQPLNGPILALVVRWYTQLMVVCFFLLALVFAWHAAWLGRAASPAQRAEAKAGFGRWALALGAAGLALVLVKVLLALNSGLVSFAATHATNFSVDAVTSTGSVLATAVINLGLAGLKLYFNLLYTVRLVFIVVLLAISPLVIWSLALKGVRGGFALWAAELVANIMMQASHALVLAALLSLLALGPTHTLLDRWFGKIVLMTLVVPLGRFLRNLANSWLYVAGMADDHAGGMLGGFGQSLSNLGRMVGWGGQGGVFPPAGGEGGNDYEIGGTGGGRTPGGGSPGGPETWGAPVSGLPSEGVSLSGPLSGEPVRSGSWPVGSGAASGERFGPGGAEAGSGGAALSRLAGNGPGGTPLSRGTEGLEGGAGVDGGSPGPGFAASEEGTREGFSSLGSRDWAPEVGSGAGETGAGWHPTLDSLPDWRSLGEGSELPPLEF